MLNDSMTRTVILYGLQVLIYVFIFFGFKMIKGTKLAKYLPEIKVLVNAVESKFGPGMGEQKKNEVTQMISQIFKGKLTPCEVDLLIEAAVTELNAVLKSKILTVQPKTPESEQTQEVQSEPIQEKPVTAEDLLKQVADFLNSQQTANPNSATTVQPQGIPIV